MKLPFLAILLLVNLSVFAQLKPIYLRGAVIVQDSTKATAYGVYGKLTAEDLYVLKIFDLNNNLKSTGSYKDQFLKIAHGAFVYYDDIDRFNYKNATNFKLKGKTRFISAKGSFVDGYENGRWISFFPDGKIKEVITYVNGVKHGFYGAYDKRGKIVASGAYNLGERVGEWLYDKGKVKKTFGEILQ